jgi:hypothetical protein
MTCPVNSISSFINLQTIPTITDISNITQPSGAPFQIRFAPRSVPLTLLDNTNFITEDTQNTLIHKGINFSLASAQICNPNSGPGKTYTLFTQTKSTLKATLIFTFISSKMDAAIQKFQENPEESIAQTPLMVLLIIPIYEGEVTGAKNIQYLQDINSKESKPTYANMQVLLQGLSYYRYTACLKLSTPPLGIITDIYNFTNGITVSDYAKLGFNTPLSPFALGGIDTSNTLSWQVDTAESSDYRTKIQYYKTPIPASNFTNNNLTTGLTTNQYQCFPFDTLSNLTPDASGIKLKTIVDNQTTTNNTVGAMLSFSQLYVLVWPILGVLIALSLLGLFLLFWKMISNRKVPTIPVIVPTAPPI